MLILVASIPPTRAQFVLASWDYPDECGQGIMGIKMWENSTGDWLPVPYYTHYYPDYHEELGTFYYLNYYQDHYFYNWSAGAAMKMRVDTLLNSTLTGAVDLADGQNYHRHNVIVTSAGTIIFSQSNFIYEDSGDIGAPMYYYEYYVILNFIPADGQIYTVTVTYEIYY
jgi:hypothetical protein